MTFATRPLGWIRDRYADQSVRWRLLALFTAVIGLISLFIFFFFPATIERQARRGIDARAEGVGAMAAFSMGPAVAFEDSAGISEALTAVLQSGDVLRVEVLDLSGSVLATMTPSGADAYPSTLAGGSNLPTTADVMIHTTPVTMLDGPIAELRLAMSLASLNADVTRARGLVALVSFAVFLLGILSAVLIAEHVTAPLREVAATAERIASGDLDSRAPQTSGDEVGQLASTFNRMVDRLQHAHGQVEVARSRLEQVLDNVPADVAMFDPMGHFVYVNPAVADDPEERAWVVGKTPLEFSLRAGLGEESGREALTAIEACVETGEMVATEGTVTPPDGEPRHFVRFYSAIRGASGSVAGVIAYGVDLTTLRATEEELRETHERLLQSQKMESIGRLAGGVAHDFNNLLTTISGNADLLLMEPDMGSGPQEMIDEILGASERAAALTQQLLAFSRKQVTQPKVLNLNQTLSGIEKMLKRLIGEDVELDTDLEEPLSSVLADPGQIEQVIVNLAVNSRDAMPRGGVLRLLTRNLTLDEGSRGGFDDDMAAGDYVQITVSDTGTGMDAETLERIFEPFFTRKEVGKGTGLGLATVYGIVHQSEGFVRVYSELGLGTTFKIFLPAVDAEADPSALGPHSTHLAPGTETILVAEDQDGVRTVTGRVLRRCGYRVLSAAGPDEALQIARDHPDEIHLLLTDVVMPVMSGPELATELAMSRPDTAVIYMSGYTDDQLQHHGVLNQDVILVQKPFTSSELARAVRDVLDRPASSTHAHQVAEAD